MTSYGHVPTTTWAMTSAATLLGGQALARSTPTTAESAADTDGLFGPISIGRPSTPTVERYLQEPTRSDRPARSLGTSSG